MKTIEFNLDTYKRIASGELIGSVQTRRGIKVYVKRIDGEGEYPMIAQLEGSAVFYTYTKDGRIRANNEDEDDLVIILKEKAMETKLVRVPFDLELAKKITSGEIEGRVVTRGGYNVRILCYDIKGTALPIIALVEIEDGKEDYFTYYESGNYDISVHSSKDLMLEIPEYTTFKDGDVLYVKVNDGNQYIFIYLNNGKDKTFVYAALDDIGTLFIEKNRITYNDDISELRFATEEEKQKLITALKESKKPKAKECLKILGIEQNPEYEFKPKDWVLCKSSDEWCLCRFSHKTTRFDGVLMYVTVGGIAYDNCIPYNEQTAHLIGTTDNWEE